MATTYKFTLEDTGLDAINLPCSSFSYRSSSESASGSLIIEGHDYSAEIADRIAGDLKLIKTVDGADTEIFTAEIDSMNTFLSPESSTFSIEFSFDSYTQTKYSSALSIDGLISYAAQQNSEWSFRTHDIDPQIQHGISVEYDSIDYYIADITVNYSADSGGTMTLNEGAESQSESGSGATCTFEILTGVPVISELNNSCAVSIISTGGRLIYDGYSIINPDWGRCKYYTFELLAESVVTIEITGSMPDLTFDGVSHSGFECTIASGEFTAFYGLSLYSISKIYCGDIFTATLSIGLYTIRLINIINPAAAVDAFTLSLVAV
jgi:hypothetical protein